MFNLRNQFLANILWSFSVPVPDGFPIRKRKVERTRTYVTRDCVWRTPANSFLFKILLKFFWLTRRTTTFHSRWETSTQLVDGWFWSHSLVVARLLSEVFTLLSLLDTVFHLLLSAQHQWSKSEEEEGRDFPHSLCLWRRQIPLIQEFCLLHLGM